MEYSGLALRGHDEHEDAKNRGNFLELFEFASRYNPSIMSQSSQTCNYKSNVFDNEFAFKELKSLFPNIFTLLAIFLTMPVSSAEGERAFSCLKRIKSYLRSTMGQTRLSSLALINVHSRIAENLDINHLIDIFASRKDRKLKFF